MLLSNKSKQLVEAICTDSPIVVTEIFADYMKESAEAKVALRRKAIAGKLFAETFESDMDEAVEYVMDAIAVAGPEILENTVMIAARAFHVSEKELIGIIAEEFLPKEVDYTPISEGFLEALIESVDKNSDIIISFQNNSARQISSDEAKTILELWNGLNHENRHKMESTMIKDVPSFENILDFAEGAFNA